MILTFQVIKQAANRFLNVLKRYYSSKLYQLQQLQIDKDLIIEESALTDNYQVSIFTRLLRLFKQGTRLNRS